MKRLVAATIVWLVFGWLPTAGAGAWEIELRSHVVSRSAVVRLGDVAMVSGLDERDAEPVRQIILAPGPSPSYRRDLTASQIRKVLLQRGVELDGCRFLGASRSVVSFDAGEEVAAAAAPTASSSGPLPTVDPRKHVLSASYRASGSSAIVESAERILADVVQARLEQLAGAATPWHVQVTIHRQSLKDLPRQIGDVTVEGLDTADQGSHQLVACFADGEGAARIPFQVQVARQVERIVPIRPLQRGEVVRAGDVELRHVPNESTSGTWVQRIDDVVGRQVQLPMKAGEPIDASALQRPILVKRRDTLDVVARRGCIVVKIRARAIQDGAEGDSIVVERLDDSKARFLARVVGYQSAEVFVGSASAKPASEK